MVNVGISTASMFLKANTEDALAFYAINNVNVAEVFLSTYYEYANDFAKTLKNKVVNSETKIHSVHVLNTQFEPQLFSLCERQRKDAMKILETCMSSAKIFGAKYYTFHGVARVKKTPLKVDFDRIGKVFSDVDKFCLSYGIKLTLENVHWAYYNQPGFFSEVKKRCPDLAGCLDVKQARQSGLDYKAYIEEMGPAIKTVHISDIDNTGKMCLPGKGVTDIDDMFSRLRDNGFDGSIIIEAYCGDYKEKEELIESYDFLCEKSAKYFK